MRIDLSDEWYWLPANPDRIWKPVYHSKCDKYFSWSALEQIKDGCPYCEVHIPDEIKTKFEFITGTKWR